MATTHKAQGSRFGIGRRVAIFWTLAIATILCVVVPVIATTPSNPDTAIAQTGDVLDQGRSLYEAGRYEQAAIALEQAAQSYRAQKDPLPLAATLANLSLVYQQVGAFDQAVAAIEESLSLLKTQTADRSTWQTQAQVLDVQGRLLLTRGEGEKALAAWQQAEVAYQQAGDEAGVTKSQLNQAQALRSLGFNRRALEQLNRLNGVLQDAPDSRQKAIALRSLGDALQLSGDPKQAEAALEKSLSIAQRLQLPSETAATLLSLGNLTRAQKNSRDAIAYYQTAASLATTSIVKAQAQLSHLNLLIDDQQWTEIQLLLPQIPPQLEGLPPSRAGVYARINFAQALLRLGSARGLPATRSTPSPTLSAPSPFSLIPYPNSLSQLLKTTLEAAIRQARELRDPRAESYALGTLGAVYEQTGQVDNAKQTTQKALTLAQASNTGDVAYRWQWQLGRLLRQENDVTEALKAYDAAIANLTALRSDLAATNSDVQFNFRNSIEPVYRQSVELLLRAEAQESNPKQRSELLKKVLDRIEALQLAELDNYFREACLVGKSVPIDQLVDKDNPNTAIIYPIVLRQQRNVSIQVIAKIPNQPLKRYSVKTMSEADFKRSLDNLQLLLATALDNKDLAKLRSQSQEVYNWLVKPIEEDIAALTAKTKTLPAANAAPGVDTLVFVLDDALRSIPMAMLWDGQRYLVEKYGIALSLGLQLFDPKPIAKEPLRVLAAGLSQPSVGAVGEFKPLPYVQSEIKSISSLGVSTTSLLNQDFTSTTLRASINAAPFNVVHLATHGNFSSRAEDTYVLATDGPINVTQFDTLLRSRDISRPEAIQLLVLSACQTASNDDRATLGLAGFAVRAGARSTLASLRIIPDESTALLVEEFYKQLNNPKQTITKAEALRRAQLSLLKGSKRDFQRPLNWAPFVLIGNWL